MFESDTRHGIEFRSETCTTGKRPTPGPAAPRSQSMDDKLVLALCMGVLVLLPFSESSL